MTDNENETTNNENRTTDNELSTPEDETSKKELRTLENKALLFTTLAAFFILYHLLCVVMSTFFLSGSIDIDSPMLRFVTIAPFLTTFLLPIASPVFVFLGRHYGIVFLRKNKKGSFRVHLSKAMGISLIVIYLLYAASPFLIQFLF